jgi:hypothetical protein
MDDRRRDPLRQDRRDLIRTAAGKHVALHDERSEMRRRPDFGSAGGRSHGGKPFAIKLVAAGVEKGEDGNRAGDGAGGLGMDRQRAETDDRAFDDEGEAARRGNADPEAGERARSDGHGDPVEIGEGEPRLGHRRLDHAEQPLGMGFVAFPILRNDKGLIVAGGNSDRTGLQRGVDGKELHRRRDSPETRRSRGQARPMAGPVTSG